VKIQEAPESFDSRNDFAFRLDPVVYHLVGSPPENHQNEMRILAAESLKVNLRVGLVLSKRASRFPSSRQVAVKGSCCLFVVAFGFVIAEDRWSW
jgi:hypothetical protein